MIAAGIDSAEMSGIAILDGPQLVRHGTCKVLDWQAIERAAEEIARYKPDVVAVEDVFIGANGDTALVLAKLVGRWVQSFERRGIRTTTVLASAWQAEMLPITTRARRAERKAAAIAWAATMFGISLPEDQADAAAIAAWALRSQQAAQIEGKKAARSAAPTLPGVTP